MIKECIWKGQRINCSSLFSMTPTDQGMCCSFNKQRADEIFKKGRYQEQMGWLNDQDKNMSFEDAQIPPW